MKPTIEKWLFYFHDGILERTEEKKKGCSHVEVTIKNGIPIKSKTFIFY